MIHTCLQTSLTSTSKWYLRISSYKLTNHGRHETNIFLCVVFSLYTKYVHSGPNRVSNVEFIVGNTVEFVNVTYRLITCFLLRSDDIMRKPENLMKSNQKVACI